MRIFINHYHHEGGHLAQISREFQVQLDRLTALVGQERAGEAVRLQEAVAAQAAADQEAYAAVKAQDDADKAALQEANDQLVADVAALQAALDALEPAPATEAPADGSAPADEAPASTDGASA